MGLFSRFRKTFVESNTLYFPGCVTYFKFKEIFDLYKKIFYKLGIGFKVINKKICCGLPALEAGYEQEARKLARKNFEIFKELGIQEIITNSPEAYKMFLQEYPEFLPDWNIEVQNLWGIILDKLKNRPRLIKNKAMGLVTYHDSCYLGRYCGIYNEPREILELIGYEIKEISDSGANSMCCGSCGRLPTTNPELADKIAKERVLQAKRLGVKKMIVASLENYQLLKRNIGDSGVKILELSEVLASALGIRKKEVEEDLPEEKISGEEKILLNTEANMELEEELKEEDFYDKEEEI